MLFRSVLSVALFAASAVAKIALTTYPSAVVAGSTYTISWTGGDDTPVTLILRKGDPTNLQIAGTITTSATGGSYSWTAPSTFAPGNDYAFEIEQSGDNNYSALISYTGGVAPVSSSAVASVASSASASFSPSVVTSSFSGFPTYEPSPHFNGTNITSSASIGVRTSTSTSIYVPSTSAQLTTSVTKPTATPATVPSSMGTTLKSPLALIFGAIAAMIYLQ